MGSLDVSGAKEQFFQLVDAISTSHLPSFTIWLDAKLAEYKTIGQLKPDTEYESKEQYPEWIGKALRQNLSFLFPGSSETLSLEKDSTPAESPGARKRRSSQTSDVGSERKRRKQSFHGGDADVAAGTEGDLLMIVKAEPGVKETSDYSRVTETPLPGIQSTFSLSMEPATNFRPPQSAEFSFTMPSKSVTSSPAAMTPTNQTLPASLPRQTFSDNTESNSNSGYPESLPYFPPSAVKKLKTCPQLSAPSPGEASVAYPVSSGAAESSETEGSEGAGVQGITQESVQDVIRRYHGGRATYDITAQMIKDLKNSDGKFVCPLCKKETMSTTAYRRHFITHTTEKPFACPYCPLRANISTSIVRHQKRMHGDRPTIYNLINL